MELKNEIFCKKFLVQKSSIEGISDATQHLKLQCILFEVKCCFCERGRDIDYY